MAELPAGWVKKQVNEKFAIGLTYDAPDLKEGQTISTVETSVTPEGLTLDGDPTIDGATVEQMVKAGVSKARYTVLFKVTTSAGHVYLDNVVVIIID